MKSLQCFHILRKSLNFCTFPTTARVNKMKKIYSPAYLQNRSSRMTARRASQCRRALLPSLATSHSRILLKSLDAKRNKKRAEKMKFQFGFSRFEISKNYLMKKSLLLINLISLKFKSKRNNNFEEMKIAEQLIVTISLVANGFRENDGLVESFA